MTLYLSRWATLIGSCLSHNADSAVWILRNNDCQRLFYRYWFQNLWILDRFENLLMPFVRGNDISSYSLICHSLSPFIFAFVNWSSKASAGSSVRPPSFFVSFKGFLFASQGLFCGYWSYRVFCSLRRTIRGFCYFLAVSFWGVLLFCLCMPFRATLFRWAWVLRTCFFHAISFFFITIALPLTSTLFLWPLCICTLVFIKAFTWLHSNAIFPSTFLISSLRFIVSCLQWTSSWITEGSPLLTSVPSSSVIQHWHPKISVSLRSSSSVSKVQPFMLTIPSSSS